MRRPFVTKVFFNTTVSNKSRTNPANIGLQPSDVGLQVCRFLVDYGVGLRAQTDGQRAAQIPGRTEVQKLWHEEVHTRAAVFDENEGPVGAELREKWQPSLRVAQSVEPRGLWHVIGAGGGEPLGTIEAVENLATGNKARGFDELDASHDSGA